MNSTDKEAAQDADVTEIEPGDNVLHLNYKGFGEVLEYDPQDKDRLIVKFWTPTGQIKRSIKAGQLVKPGRRDR